MKNINILYTVLKINTEIDRGKVGGWGLGVKRERGRNEQVCTILKLQICESLIV